MHRIAIYVLATVAAVTASLDTATTRAAERRPNIILILTDDVGLGDIHYCGGPFNTPNIDKLADERHEIHLLLCDAAVRPVALRIAHRPLSVPHRP